MRELEFRAWDTVKMEMSFDQGLCHAMIRNNDGFVIEQFTSITDKNGVEIYEGDKFERGGVVEFIGSGYYVKTFREYETLKSCARYEKVIGNIHE